ncbi:MAG: thioredoxin domain-containing protein [Chloroflexota bacterium]
MTNRLAKEQSPYLLQHAENPVDWYPWGEEALSRARTENRPILVSIGYSACHWCHVMAHESFENEATARLMNEHFINVKVDREERPDVDSIFMEAVQALTGAGGWPLNIFLTPDGRPFFGGTYFPPVPGRGMAAWTQVLESVADAFRNRPDDVAKNAAVLTQHIEEVQNRQRSSMVLSPELLRSAFQGAASQFDWDKGGFGGAPKFPQPLALEFVLRMHARLGLDQPRDFVLLTLRAMAAGGIYDHLGGGFHRYTVDRSWVVPHFEKMLYDNALLARVYLQAYQLTGDGTYREVVESTLDYLIREMQAPEGGFYSAEDADSEGVEGKYYVWTCDEINEVLPDDVARIVRLRFDVRPEGNFEGKTILTATMPLQDVAELVGLDTERVSAALEEARVLLLSARSKRIPPGKDTKILAGWNGLAIRALAEAGRVLHRPDFLEAAEKSAQFVMSAMRPGSVLVRSYRGAPGRTPAFLEDYGFLIEAMLTLYETTGKLAYLRWTTDLVNDAEKNFWDQSSGAFFDTGAGDDELVVRPRSYYDNPIPSGNSAMSSGLLRLAALTGDERYERLALPAFQTVSNILAGAPLAFSYLLCALDFYLSSPLQIAVVADSFDAATPLLNVPFARYLPNKVIATGSGSEPALLANRSQIGGVPTAYVCQHFACQLPVTSSDALARQLENLATIS